MRGTFKGGVIVLDDTVSLPEGTAVFVNLTPPLLPSLPDPLSLEFVDWDKAGADAWLLIEEWGKVEHQSPETLAGMSSGSGT